MAKLPEGSSATTTTSTTTTPTDTGEATNDDSPGFIFITIMGSMVAVITMYRAKSKRD